MYNFKIKLNNESVSEIKDKSNLMDQTYQLTIINADNSSQFSKIVKNLKNN